MALCYDLVLNLLVRFQHRKKDNRIRACGAIGSVSALQAGGNGIETHLVQIEFFTAFLCLRRQKSCLPETESPMRPLYFK